jgi:hypothetical protein
MQPVTLTIKGSYWDSQIYSSELVLFDDEGAVYRLDWNKAVDEIAEQNSSVQTAIRVAFADSDLFYNNQVRKILLDPQIKAPIVQQLSSLASQQYEIKSRLLSKHENPFDFLPTDTEIYYNKIFAGDDSGLYSVARSGFQSTFGSTVSKHHDARVFQIKASEQYTSIATAMGDDGLFEFEFKRNEPHNVLDQGVRLAERPCSACDWAFQSVIGWTIQSSFFVNYFETAQVLDRVKALRVLDRVYTSDEMFSSVSPSDVIWGAREKVYKLKSNGISVSNYSRGKKAKKGKGGNAGSIETKPSFGDFGFIPADFSNESFVSAGTAPFGSVIEFDDSILVIRSDGEMSRFPGEPVQWRIFPRSNKYSNQLHIIYDDYMLIVSFVHDYFVDQKHKLAGFAKNSSKMREDAWTDEQN